MGCGTSREALAAWPLNTEVLPLSRMNLHCWAHIMSWCTHKEQAKLRGTCRRGVAAFDIAAEFGCVTFAMRRVDSSCVVYTAHQPDFPTDGWAPVGRLWDPKENSSCTHRFPGGGTFRLSAVDVKRTLLWNVSDDSVGSDERARQVVLAFPWFSIMLKHH